MLEILGKESALVGHLAYRILPLRLILENSLNGNNSQILPNLVLADYTTFVVDRPDLWDLYVDILEGALEEDFGGFVSIVNFGLVQKVDPFSEVGRQLSGRYGPSLRSAEALVWKRRYPDSYSPGGESRPLN